MTLNLFMFYVGGEIANCNIEVHDVRFSIGQTAQDCFDDLRQQWWGDAKSLHVDSWAEISHADGYDVAIADKPSGSQDRLFFLNLGGYAADRFEEDHQNVLIVATTQREAVKRALQKQTNWRLPHKDNLLELEKALSLSAFASKRGYRLHLTKVAECRPLKFRSKYTPLG
jgi:Domain of Unknown Function (DUF1543)